jgi:hypothetical protein
MPSYAQVLTDAYLPAQAAKLRWESAKAVAGAQFDALAEQRRAVDDVRLRSQLYAQNIRPNEAGTDAFIFQAVQAMAGTPAPTGCGGGRAGATSPAFNGALERGSGAASRVRPVQDRICQFGCGAAGRGPGPHRGAVQRPQGGSADQGLHGSLVQPPGLTTAAKLKERAQAGDRAAQAQYTQVVGLEPGLDRPRGQPRPPGLSRRAQGP